MSDTTSDRFDRSVARANPIDDETVAELPLSGAESDLLEEIVKTPAPELDKPARRPVVVMLAAAAVAAVLTAGLVAVPRLTKAADPAGSPAPAVVGTSKAKPATPAPNLPANARPSGHQMLLYATGWRVWHTEEFGGLGQVSYKNDRTGRSLSVEWRPVEQYASMIRDTIGATTTRVQVLGRPGVEFAYQNYISTLLRPSGATFLDIRADGMPAAEYHDLIGRLRWVDRAAWVAALPSSAIVPSRQPAVIAAMLADIPKPDGFDVRKLRTQQDIERYDLGAAVAGAVTCRWIEDWDKARRAGDAEQIGRALDALKSSKRWKILLEMQRTGDFTRILWDYVDQVAAGTLPKDYRMGLCS